MIFELQLTACTAKDNAAGIDGRVVGVENAGLIEQEAG
jgi:hypothetical protein